MTVFGWLTPFLAAGFAAQVLLGALSYLVPVALGGGPTPVRAANAVMDRAAPLRLVVTNAGLLLCALPVPSTVRVLASILVLVALAAPRCRCCSWRCEPRGARRRTRRLRDRGAHARAGHARPAGQVAGLAASRAGRS